jgi:mannonate dehydratase
MKLGFGLYRHMLTPEYYAFARQAGATHVVAHLTDYHAHDEDVAKGDQPVGNLRGWGYAREKELWSAAFLRGLRDDLRAHGLELAALENISPAFWHDVLLDGPRRAEHIENVCQLIRNMGEAGIPILGYNFSLAGVAGREQGPWARGGALSVGLDGPSEHLSAPVPNGMVWNMIYDKHAPAGDLPTVSSDALWDRVRRFLADVMPVAEAAGVQLAAHPDDPPLAMVRQQPRLVYQPHHYDRLLGLHASPHNQLEFCLGSLVEMTEGDVYEAVDHYTRLGRVAYIHFRNVRGKVPFYKETFVDDGDLDMVRVMRILKQNRWDGVIIPDHAPQMTCAAPWHAGMAYAMGYIRALQQSV